jgi:hypothetical protein
VARQNVRLVTVAWGRRYVDALLDFALPAALAPGNLPALAAAFDCTAVIVTEQKLFAYVRAHPSTRKLEQVCRVELIPLDDLVSDSWQYGMTLAYALFRGFAGLGSGMTGTYILFLNADFILADGSYGRLIDRIRSGEQIHLAPSYCTVEERVVSRLRARRNQNGGILAVPPREMAALILDHRHNTIRVKTVNQPVFEFELADQFYWKVDAHTLIGHQMPIALIGMRPERELTDLSSFWDWGVGYDFCRPRRLAVIGDSDDFLMMELRSESRSMESIHFGRSPPKILARRLRGHITQYQVDNSQFELLLHSRDLPSGMADARRKLRAYVDGVLSHLRSIPAHLGHRQWVYHQRHFRWRLERKFVRLQVARIGSEIERTQSALTRERALMGMRLKGDDWEGALPRLESEYAGKLQALQRESAQLNDRLKFRARWAARICRWIAGAPYPYQVSSRRLQSLIRQAAGSRTLRILAVCPAGSLLLPALNAIPGPHVYLTPGSVANGALRMLPPDAPKFDLCVVELADLEPSGTRELLDAVAGQLGESGKLLVHWHDHGGASLRAVHSQIVHFALDRASHADAHYAGSWVSAAASAMFWMWNTPAARHVLRYRPPAVIRRAVAAVTFAVVSIPLAFVADVRERARRNQRTTIPKYCSSATFHIEFPPKTIDRERKASGSLSPH